MHAQPKTSSARPFLYPRPGKPLSCGPVALDTLAGRYGTPLYVYSADHIAGRLALFRDRFASIDHLLCYSVKANSALGILRLMADRDAGFDIVSGGELERVLHISRKAARRCVFSGVGKTAEEMDLALDADILIFNVESEGELDLLASRAARRKNTARFALRVNPDVFTETHPYISTGLREHKFGIAIERAPALYATAARHKRLRARGVSVHIGSQIRAVEPFGAAAARVAELIRGLRADGHAISVLDAGGGLGVDYGAGHQFDPGAAIEAYARSLIAAVQALNPKPRLLLEPGRFVVAQAGALLTRVLYVKENGDKRFVVTDAGMNDLIRPTLYQAHHEIWPVRPRSGAPRVADVVGPVCESGDFFARDRALPPVEPGDLLAVLDAGAYGMSLSSNYNSRPRPAEVLVSGRRAERIRRRETMRDLLRPEM